MSANDQPLLFVGSYATADAPGIHAFRFDGATGALTAGRSFAGITHPSFLTVHPNRRWLYAVGETGLAANGAGGTVWALRFDAGTGAIEAINQRSSDGDYPCHVQLDATGQWLLASNYGTGSVAMYRIEPDGGLSEMIDFIQHHGSGPNAARQEGPHAHSATFTPDNRFAIVADLGIDQLVVYALDTAAGKLRPHGAVHTQPGAGPRHLAFHPNGRHVYLGNELGNTVNAYDYDAANGTLREVQTLTTVPGNAPETYVADVHVAPAGDRLYVSNRGHDSIAVYAIGADGRLTLIGTPSCGGKWPRNFAIAPGGRYVLAANQHSDNVAVLPAQAGGLGSAAANIEVPKPSCVQFVASS
jgi:6-phosphogluconolactonase